MREKSQLEKLYKAVMPTLKEDMIQVNDAMASNPELGGQEYESSKLFVSAMEAIGLKVEYPFAGLDTAFKCTINEWHQKTVAILAEYDALPEVGHACGHCAHGTASLLAFLSLAKIARAIDSQVHIIGTPD